jgi:predicted TIM-barrel fold metal-dependent hydrolase
VDHAAAGAIDVHHHIVPRDYAEALERLGVTHGLGVRLPRWKPRTALAVMDAHHIATSIVSISAPGVYFPGADPTGEIATELARQTNEYCASLIRDHPGRFGAFATLPLPHLDAALDELAYALDELGLDGVVLLSNYDGYYLGDPRFQPLHDELDRRRAVVFVHPQSPPEASGAHLELPEAMLEVTFDTTRTAFSLVVNGVTKRHPDIRFILAHAGGAVPFLAGRVAITATMLSELRAPLPTIAETLGRVSALSPRLAVRTPDQLSYYLRFRHNVLPEGPDHFLSTFYYDTALSASPHCFSSLTSLADSSHILFGTDYIFATRAAVPLTRDGVRGYSGFTDDDVDAVLRGNAQQLMPRRSGT